MIRTSAKTADTGGNHMNCTLLIRLVDIDGNVSHAVHPQIKKEVTGREGYHLETMADTNIDADIPDEIVQNAPKCKKWVFVCNKRVWITDLDCFKVGDLIFVTEDEYFKAVC
jgi:hypothetical protein